LDFIIIFQSRPPINENSLPTVSAKNSGPLELTFPYISSPHPHPTPQQTAPKKKAAPKKKKVRTFVVGSTDRQKLSHLISPPAGEHLTTNFPIPPPPQFSGCHQEEDRPQEEEGHQEEDCRQEEIDQR
jgi:hypothetical protein